MTTTLTAELTADTLLNLGFVDVASWVLAETDLHYQLDGPHADRNGVLLDDRNALYAFVQGEKVLYIGKTARTVRQRFMGYRRPARQQRTNWRCNGKIREALGRGEEVRIFVFTPISHLRYGFFDLNLAAGLEDSLIATFDPPWNGREKGQPITEEAEREEAESVPAEGFGQATSDAHLEDGNGEPMDPDEVLASRSWDKPAFTILLGNAYYNQGLINPGAEASRYLGQDGEPIQVVFSDGTEPVVSRIDRTANSSGSVRIVGRNSAIARWFQGHFQPGETVQARILDSNRILLLAKNAQSNEFFYLEDGRRSDADLHEHMLGNEEADATTRRMIREELIAKGEDPDLVDRLYGDRAADPARSPASGQEGG